MATSRGHSHPKGLHDWSQSSFLYSLVLENPKSSGMAQYQNVRLSVCTISLQLKKRKKKGKKTQKTKKPPRIWFNSVCSELSHHSCTRIHKTRATLGKIFSSKSTTTLQD